MTAQALALQATGSAITRLLMRPVEDALVEQRDRAQGDTGLDLQGVGTGLGAGEQGECRRRERGGTGRTLERGGRVL